MRLSCLRVGRAALVVLCLYALIPLSHPAMGQTKKKTKAKTPAVVLPYPPKLPDGKEVLTATSDEFLKPSVTIGKDVAIAKTAPTVDFLYYPCQTYPGKIWS